MNRFSDIKIFTKELLESYNSVADRVMQDAEKMSEDELVKKIESESLSWQDSLCIDGISPKEAFNEYFSATKSFDEVAYMYNTFASDANDVVPEFITEAVLSYEETKPYVMKVIDNMNLELDIDKDLSPEDIKQFYEFAAALDLAARLKDEEIVDKLLQIYSLCPDENTSILECIACTVIDSGYCGKLVEIITNSDFIDIKEHTILQFLARQEKSEEIYYCIKNSLKKDSSNKIMTIEIASDYGDGRIIPILRKIAKQKLNEIYEKGLSPYAKSDDSNEFFIICNLISRLGGSTEDLLAQSQTNFLN